MASREKKRASETYLGMPIPNKVDNVGTKSTCWTFSRLLDGDAGSKSGEANRRAYFQQR
jgi:hypothetical protein